MTVSQDDARKLAAWAFLLDTLTPLELKEFLLISLGKTYTLKRQSILQKEKGEQ